MLDGCQKSMDPCHVLEECELGTAVSPPQSVPTSQSSEVELQRSHTAPALTYNSYTVPVGAVQRSKSDCIGCRRCWWKPLGEGQERSFAQTFVSALGSVPLKAPTPTFHCCICLENIPLTNQVVMSQCGREGHAACEVCLKTYLRLRIEEDRVDELRCPRNGDAGCEAHATEDELRSWVSDQVFDKYERFSRMRADPKLRACPKCCRLCSPDVNSDGTIKAEMICEDCGCTYCYYHSLAHAPGAEACAAYEKSLVKQQLCDAVFYGTKPCPSCGFPTEKVSGCNHMTCKCKVNWCWVCGRELDNVGWHYNPANPNGCMQFQEELATRRDSKLMVLCKILCLPVVVLSLVFVVFFLLCLVMTFPVPVLMCFKEVGFKVWIGIAATIVGGPFIIFSLVWGLIGLVIWLLLVPCGIGEVHLQFLLGVPFMTALAVGEGIIGPDRPGRA
mmetsp:Transcript_78866/g.223159  ORF Transcript_78866/g.223159 Transcript_78866/m.223159 type:complete len:445 (-) Transcript_78866:114-1448(-)